MKEIYEKWYPLGEDFPLLIYEGMESIFAGSLKIFFRQARNDKHVHGKKVVVEFEFHPISYRLSDESCRNRTLLALPELPELIDTSFFISNCSYFLSDFYSDAGIVYENVEFEHLLIVTSNDMFDFILDERPNVYIIDL